MDEILQGGDGWQAAIASALGAADRPIGGDPRFQPRDAAGRTNLQRYDRSRFPSARPASTLLLLYPADGQLTLPLTVRNADLRAHAGEISLPGGAVDPADASRADAALREAWEELGVEPGTVRIVGALDDIWIPVTNFELRPFVAVTDGRPRFRPHDREVAAVVELELRRVLDGTITTEEEISVPGFILRAGVFRHGEHRIWGATARTLDMLAQVLRQAGIGATPAA
jgi:8-oxo-dGTP pyrophosphatase MutT (NUDIX family)